LADKSLPSFLFFLLGFFLAGEAGGDAVGWSVGCFWFFLRGEEGGAGGKTEVLFDKLLLL
jgi:hypothetical protein